MATGYVVHKSFSIAMWSWHYINAMKKKEIYDMNEDAIINYSNHNDAC